MDLYSSVVDYISVLPVPRAWPEFRKILEHVASRRPRHWLLPAKSCDAVGGTSAQALPAVAMIACAQIGVIMLDDMLDADPRGEYHRLGFAVAANIAASFQCTGFEAIFQHNFSTRLKLEALHSANQMILTVAHGQHLDIRNPTDEVSYWRVVEKKSASFFGTALELGTLLGGAPASTVKSIKRFGQLYGEMIQIHDDLNDALAVPASPDWIQKRMPLPILFAQKVAHPARRRFVTLCQDVTKPDALREAQDILIRSGAVSYCIDQLLHRHAAVEQILSLTPLAYREPLQGLVDEVVVPVWKLFETMGIEPMTPYFTKVLPAGTA
jgi:geranylgeranyl pyrophosphate synthase